VEIDPEGSVNVASFGDRFAGVGGFVNIAHSARRLVFCCTFRAKENAKFVKRISHVCFHGPSALARGQQVLYITERAVFELTPNGLRLVEVMAGFDVQRDVLDQMEFVPVR
jgi:propionate CoA-transferase